MTDDLISRQAAIDAILQLSKVEPESCEYWDSESSFCALSKPSAQPEQKWIPCSERLPENGHYYLWCSDMGSVQSDYYWNGFENGMKYGYNIVAWMPLPEPYQGGEK